MSTGEEQTTAVDVLGEMPALKDLIDQYLDLHAQQQELEAELRPIKARKENLEGVITEQMGLAGYENVRTAAGYTMVRYKQTFVKAADGKRPELIEVLKGLGFSEALVTLNHTALYARVKEWLKDGSMPPELEPLLVMSEAWRCKALKVG